MAERRNAEGESTKSQKGGGAANPFGLFAESPFAAAGAVPGAGGMSPEDAQEFLGNMARVFERGREVWETSILAQAKEHSPLQLDPFNAADSFNEWWRSLAADPSAIAEKTLKFWSDQAEIWRRATLKAAGAEAEPVAPAPPKDKRFADPEWSQNAVFDALKQSYFLTAGFLTDMAKHEGALTDVDRKKVEFFTRQFVDAISPSNYFATNPEVLRVTLEEKGENLVRGLGHMLEDLQRGGGKLQIRQTDLDKFKVGENMAITPGKVIYRNDVFELIQYDPTTPNVEARPVLFCPPWINKYYILDLNEKKSMVKWLIGQGHTVFMISWINPGEAQKHLEFVDYIAEGLFEAWARVLDETEADKIHLVAYCIGGTMAGTALAYLAQQPEHPLHDKLASVTFFTTQLEFSDAGDLQLFIDDQQLASLDAMMKDGLLSADRMATTFNMLRSSDLIWSFVVNNYLLGKEPFPFDLLYWNSDSTRMPARMHKYYLEKFYRDDALALGALQLGEVKLDLSKIAVPSYHVCTKEDHIAPAASVYRGVKLLGGQRKLVLAGSGHIAGVINPPSLGKYQFWSREDDAFPEDLIAWRESATETPGSWWGDWDSWLKAHNDGIEPVPARQPGRRFNAIEDAPGQYVRIRADAAPAGPAQEAEKSDA